jgi:hypothetical protein
VTSLTNELQHENNFLNQNNVPNGDWICFNFGKELYTYSYRGVKKVRFKLNFLMHLNSTELRMITKSFYTHDVWVKMKKARFYL